MSKKLSIMIYQSTFFVFLYINQCFISLFNHVDCSCVFSTKFMLLILRNHTLKCILSLNKEKTISVLRRYLRMFQFIIHIKHNIFKQFQDLVNTTFCFKSCLWHIPFSILLPPLPPLQLAQFQTVGDTIYFSSDITCLFFILIVHFQWNC